MSEIAVESYLNHIYDVAEETFGSDMKNDFRSKYVTQMKQARNEAKELLAGNNPDFDGAIAKLKEGMDLANKAYKEVSAAADGDTIIDRWSGMLTRLTLPKQILHVYGIVTKNSYYIHISRTKYTSKESRETPTFAKKDILECINMYNSMNEIAISACTEAKHAPEAKRTKALKLARKVMKDLTSWLRGQYTERKVRKY